MNADDARKLVTEYILSGEGQKLINTELEKFFRDIKEASSKLGSNQVICVFSNDFTSSGLRKELIRQLKLLGYSIEHPYNGYTAKVFVKWY